MADSVFTKIVNGEIPAQKVYEDDLTLAFLDINPLTPGHTLVIPKAQIDHLDECSPELYAAIFATVQKVSKRMKEVLQPIRVALAVHGYDVPHAHVHVLPSYDRADLKLVNRPELQPDYEALAQMAKKLAF